MSQDASIKRRQVHLRRITCEGFEREDGLFDIEGTLIDTKPYSVDLPEKSLPAHAPIHEMRVRLTLDRQRQIHDAVANTVHGPYAICGNISDGYRKLIGLHIEPGFTNTVKRMFRGVLGCSHLTELLPPMATVAFQIVWAEPEGFGAADKANSRQRSSPLGGCHALRLDGEVVRLHFPHLLPPNQSGE